MLHRMLFGLIFLAPAAVAGRAEDPKVSSAPASKDAEALEALNKEYESAAKPLNDKFRKAFEAAKKAGKEKSLDPPKEFPPNDLYSPRFLAIAEKNPDGPVALDALLMTMKTSGGPSGKPGTWAKAIKVLQNSFVKKPGVDRVFRPALYYNDEAAERFVRDVIAKNPDREIQYKGCRALADVRRGHVAPAKKMQEDKEILPRLERILGKAEMAKYLALCVHAQQEEDELRRTIREKYSDFVTQVLDVSVAGRPPR